MSTYKYININCKKGRIKLASNRFVYNLGDQRADYIATV